MAKKYKCPYCEDRYIRKDLIDHIDKEHEDLIPENSESAQVVYDLVNGTKGAGRCRVCSGPTMWNTSSKRYDVLCKNPRCSQKMREDYQKNMLRVHGTYNILTSDEQQKKMLANRSISGKYKFTDGGVVTYTGSYEKKFLEFADKVMQIPSKDIMAPGPTIEYEMNGEKHFYITDFLYIPYNLIIEVKDGGTNPNNKSTPGMQSSRQRTIEKEKLITDRGEYNYLRLTDNQFVQLLEIFMDIKKALIEGNDDKIVRINESYIEESKSTIDNNYKPKGKKNLSSFKRVHLTDSVIDKYKKEYPFLKHVRCKDTEEYICDGYIWFDNDELVAMVGSCEYTDDKTKWIVSLEITKNYKGYGLSKQILNYATKNMDCKYLSVSKNNKLAKKVYDDYGFKVYQESDTMYYMTIDKNIKESYLEESTNGNLYHLSKENLDGKTLSPRVPSNFLVQNGYEDGETKRVCFAKSIDGSLRGMSQNLKGVKLYVHIPDKNYDVYNPTIKEVPDCKVTGEVWIKEPVKLKCIGFIEVIDDKGEDGIPYKYGNKTAELYDWNWKWIDKFNESNIFTSGDFEEYREIGEHILQELQDEQRESNLKKLDEIASLEDNWNDNGANAFDPRLIDKVREIIEQSNIQPDVFPTACNSIQLEYSKKSGMYLEFEVTLDDTKYEAYRIDSLGKEKLFLLPSKIEDINKTVNEFYNESVVSYDDLTKFTAYHLEPIVRAKPKKVNSRMWDRELYYKSIESAIINNIRDNYECKRYNDVYAYVYAAGYDLRPIYLGTIHIFNKYNPNDWEWEEQEILDKKTYDYLIKHPMAEATDIRDFYEDEDYE